jgi:DNA modification methylase
MSENLIPLTVELRDIRSISPYERNPRINDNAVDAVAASLKEFGFRQPIVVDADNIIIAGHTRYKAALKLGLQKVPVHIVTDLSPEQVKAYRIADNKTGEIAEWDLNILPIELTELKAAEFDMNVLAFSDKELTRMLNVNISQGSTEPDAVPESPDEPVTQQGDIWLLGNHRLMCGDSADKDDFSKLLNGNKIQLVNTDPPYNVKVEPRSNNAVAVGKANGTMTHHQEFDLAVEPDKPRRTTKKMRAKDRPLANDFISDEAFDKLLDAWFCNIVSVLEPGRTAYIWGGYANVANYPPFLKKHGLYLSQILVWNKLHPVLTRKDFMGLHEMCFYCWKEGAGHQFFGAANIPDLWEVKKIPPQSMIHLTEKPVELAMRAIQYSSRPGENVLEIFGGSGSTLIACEQTGRNCFVMEIDQLYCDVIVKRWEEFTGRKAVRLTAETEVSHD